MASRNAENSNQAKLLAKEMRNAANIGEAKIRQMTEAMRAIQESSRNTSAILKSIDEIAFQTNTLALNASVEAARAGDAGSGFSVVADEVRSLAQRCAKAAEETAVKIEVAIQHSDSGNKLNEEVSHSLNDITSKVNTITELVSEISSSCNEQKEGVTEISTAMASLEETIQKNASTSQLTAGAAHKLNTQSEQLLVLVDELLVEINGDNDKTLLA